MGGRNSRLVSLQALQRWETGRDFADDILHRALGSSDLNAINRSFVTETFYGVIRNRTCLDFIIRRFRGTKLDDATRQVLRLGLYQLYHMRVPHHAAVYETVNIAGPARTLVNAILRRAITEKESVQRELEAAPPHIRYSHPEFLFQKWERKLGKNSAEQLCRWNNAPAKIYVRANGLRTTGEELLNSCTEAKMVAQRSDCLEVDHLPLEWIASGIAYVQDPSTLVACELLDPQPDEVVLDACAAPGGKTGYMAQLMSNHGTLVACDYDPQRLNRLKQNLTRLGVSNTKILNVDWIRDRKPFAEESFRAVLLDAPCTNTGVIRRRTDVRWRLNPDDFSRMSRLQTEILSHVLPTLSSGGRLVYSTCSIEEEENEDVAQKIIDEFPELELIETKTRIPTRDDMDGAYAVLFRKS